ncbi:MAG: orotidine-5'-phosphate decarboxylase, partial [Chloroflexota bacterium]
MTTTYLERLAARTAATGTVLCLGVDPDPAALPAGFSPDLAGVERFARLLVEAALPFAAAIKPNLAFFEAHGSAGIAALERLRALVPADVPFVADAKRGDIGTTAARQAIALFDVLGADAITVNPYLGEEAVAPLLERTDRFAYVLCRTSNPGASELQGLRVAEDDGAGHPAEPLWSRVARRAASWGPGGTVGLVVGATAPG